MFVKSIIYKENTDNADVEFLMKNDKEAIQSENFKNKRFQEEIKYLLRLFDEKGVWAAVRKTVEQIPTK